MTATRRAGTRRAPATRRAQLGVSLADYAVMLEAQGGGCAVCGKPPKPGGRALDVDHDHKTGRVRGLLCWTCNHKILGKYATAAKLRAAADYLELHTAGPCYICGAEVEPAKGWRRGGRAWCPEHQPVWSRA